MNINSLLKKLEKLLVDVDTLLDNIILQCEVLEDKDRSWIAKRAASSRVKKAARKIYRNEKKIERKIRKISAKHPLFDQSSRFSDDVAIERNLLVLGLSSKGTLSHAIQSLNWKKVKEQAKELKGDEKNVGVLSLLSLIRLAEHERSRAKEFLEEHSANPSIRILLLNYNYLHSKGITINEDVFIRSAKKLERVNYDKLKVFFKTFAEQIDKENWPVFVEMICEFDEHVETSDLEELYKALVYRMKQIINEPKFIDFCHALARVESNKRINVIQELQTLASSLYTPSNLIRIVKLHPLFPRYFGDLVQSILTLYRSFHDFNKALTVIEKNKRIIKKGSEGFAKLVFNHPKEITTLALDFILTLVRVLGVSSWFIGDSKKIYQEFVDANEKRRLRPHEIKEKFKEHFGSEPLIDLKPRKYAFRVEGKRVKIVFTFPDFEWRFQLHQILQFEFPELKNTAFFRNHSLDHIIEAMFVMVQDNIRRLLRDQPKLIFKNQLFVRVNVTGQHEAQINMRNSTEELVLLEIGIREILYAYLIEVASIKDIFVRRIIQHHHYFNRKLEYFEREYTLYSMLEHEFTHHLDGVNKIYIYEQDDQISKIRTEGLARFKDYQRYQVAPYDCKLITRTKPKNIDWFYYGYLMTFTIGLAIMFKDNPGQYNNLRVWLSKVEHNIKEPNSQRFITLGEGFSAVFNHTRRAYFQNLPQEYILKTIAKVEQLAPLDFVREYLDACDLLKIPKEVRVRFNISKDRTLHRRMRG